jgi:protein gp37
MGNPKYINGFELTLHEYCLGDMSDLFHEQIPLEYIQRVFSVMNQAHWHTFQVLTKRDERLQSLPHSSIGPQYLARVTVENNNYKGRIDALRNIPAKVKFVSFEPLVGKSMH